MVELNTNNLPCAVCGTSIDYSDGGIMDGKPLRVCSRSGCSSFTSRTVEVDGRTQHLCSGHWEAFKLREKVAELQAENIKLRKDLRNAKSKRND
jgi:hypothetical protein